jgi:O-acetyl-ADP-ribose deacetylase (regulator of RNase III)
VNLEAVRGDITAEVVDAIVNAANSSLLGGGGVDGAIHAAAGPALMKACREVRRTQWHNGLPTGQAVATTGGLLPATFVIHTVGPKHWQHADGGITLLAECHTHALAEAERVGARTIAFPAISCGALGWSTRDASWVAVAAVRTYAEANPDSTIELVRFVLFDQAASADFTRAIAYGE